MKVLAALAVVSACMISTNASAYYAVAIVKTSDGGWSSGWSWNADSQEAAEAAALRRCHANRKGQCHIIAGGKKGAAIGTAVGAGGIIPAKVVQRVWPLLNAYRAIQRAVS